MPSVEVAWSFSSPPETPGEIFAAELRILAHRPVLRLRTRRLDGPAARFLVSIPASFDGIPTPGEPIVIPVLVRVPGTPVPSLEARVEIEGEIGTYEVGASLDITPRALRPPPVIPRTVDTPTGLIAEFPVRSSRASRLRTAGSPSGISRVVRISGRFLYRDRLVGPTGFLHAENDSNPVNPVRFADLELIENDGPVPVATGFTDSTGAFEFTRNLDGSEAIRIRLRSATSQWGGADGAVLRVRTTGTGALYGGVTGDVTGITGDTDLGTFVLEPGEGGEAMNLLDMFFEGAREVNLLSGAWPTVPLTAYWSETSTVGTYFSRSEEAIYLLAAEGYDDSVVLHEFGHAVSHLYSKDETLGGVHYIDDSRQDPRLSWSEGFASYFQGQVRARLGDLYPSWYIDTRGTAGAGQLYFSYEAEGPGTLLNATGGGAPVYTVLFVRGPGSEMAVHGALWDILDAAGTPGDLDPPGIDDDGVAAGRGEIWEVLSGPMLAASEVTIEDFWTGWFDPAVANGQDEAMIAAFSSLGLEFTLDDREDDAAGPLGPPLLVGAPPVHRTFYPAGDVDLHALPLEAGSGVTVETFNLGGYGDTALEILAPDQSVLVQNDDRYPGELGSAVSFVAPVEGTYLVRVLRSFGDTRSQHVSFGSYEVRAVGGGFEEPPLVAVSGPSGTGNRGFGIGTAFADYDRDGWPDLVLVNNEGRGSAAGKDALYRNNGNFTFTNVVAAAGLGNPQGGLAAAWGDADGDGDLDLFLSEHALYRNQGNGTFSDMTAASGVADVAREVDASWVDSDGDGDLDLFVVRRDAPSGLWRNDGGWTFSWLSDAFDLPLSGGNAYGCAWADFDVDGLPDLFLAHRDLVAERLFHNGGGNQFEEVTEAAGLGSNVPASGGAWGDVDGDGDLDLFVASSGPDRLYLNQGDGTFLENARAWGVDDPGLAAGCGFADADLDGDLDLFVSVQGAPSLLYRNLGTTMVRTSQAAAVGPGWGCAWGDVDRDGDPDLYQAFGCDVDVCESNQLYRNLTQETSARTWLQVALEGTVSNRDGLGARIAVHAGALHPVREVGTGVGWASKSRLPESFGLGNATAIDSVEVAWPSGMRTVIVAPSRDTLLTVVERASTPVLPPREPPAFTLHLGPSRPNPFVDAVNLTVAVTRSSRVAVDVYDLRGRRVRRLLDRELAPGTHVVGWNGRDDHGDEAPPGVYLYRAAGGGAIIVRKLVRLGR